MTAVTPKKIIGRTDGGKILKSQSVEQIKYLIMSMRDSLPKLRMNTEAKEHVVFQV